MNTTEFRAAVELIIGVPSDPDESFDWDLDTSSGQLRVACGTSIGIHLRFLETPFPDVGENPITGSWHIHAEDFNNDPKDVLRELVRRLARAGYFPPPCPPEMLKPITADLADDPTECSSEAGITIGVLDTICTMVHLLKSREVPETGATGEALEDARATIQRCKLLVKPSARSLTYENDLGLIHRAAERIEKLEADGCGAITLTQDEQHHLAALLETAVEPQENRPSGLVGSVWQGQQDAWTSILEKLKA